MTSGHGNGLILTAVRPMVSTPLAEPHAGAGRRWDHKPGCVSMNRPTWDCGRRLVDPQWVPRPLAARGQALSGSFDLYSPVKPSPTYTPAMTSSCHSTAGRVLCRPGKGTLSCFTTLVAPKALGLIGGPTPADPLARHPSRSPAALDRASLQRAGVHPLAWARCQPLGLLPNTLSPNLLAGQGTLLA